MGATATRMTAEQYYAVTVEGDRKQLVDGEIRSPGTWRYDVGAKKRVYESGGLPELWLVDDASETVLVYRRTSAESATFDVSLELGRGEALTSPQLPGFELALDGLFAR